MHSGLKHRSPVHCPVSVEAQNSETFGLAVGETEVSTFELGKNKYIRVMDGIWSLFSPQVSKFDCLDSANICCSWSLPKLVKVCSL